MNYIHVHDLVALKLRQRIELCFHFIRAVDIHLSIFVIWQAYSMLFLWDVEQRENSIDYYY